MGMAANEGKPTGKTAPTYLELREELLRRDRSLRHKVVSLEEATSFVRDGDSVGIGGSTMSRTPMGMIGRSSAQGEKGSPARAASSLATATCCMRQAPVITW